MELELVILQEISSISGEMLAVACNDLISAALYIRTVHFRSIARQ